MGSLLATGAGFAGSAASVICCGLQGVMCACTMARCCCSGKSGDGQWNPRAAKAGYIVMLGLATIMALIMRYNSGFNIDLVAWKIGCDAGAAGAGKQESGGTFDASSYQAYCKGDAAVYRISFVSSVFFFFMILGSKLIGEGFHAGLWGVKLVVYFGMIAGSFFLGNDVFNNSGYAWLARVCSALFLVLQIMILVEFGYKWNESWVDKAYEGQQTDYEDPPNKKWLYYILLCAAGMYIGSIVGIILLFVYYGKGPEGTGATCGTNNFFIAITLVFVIALTAMSLFRERLVGEGHVGAILPAAVVSCYATYLLWSSMNSGADKNCNPTTRAAEGTGDDNADGGSPANVALGLLIATVSLMYTSYSASVNAGSLWDGGNDDDKAEAELKKQETASREGAGTADEREALDAGDAGSHMSIEDGRGGKAGAGRGAKYVVRDAKGEERAMTAKERGHGEPYWFFHLIMMTASMYMAMLLTNWGAIEDAGADSTEPSLANNAVGDTSKWVKIVSQWLTFALYIWTLVAPRCCPGREFEH